MVAVVRGWERKEGKWVKVGAGRHRRRSRKRRKRKRGGFKFTTDAIKSRKSRFMTRRRKSRSPKRTRRLRKRKRRRRGRSRKRRGGMNPWEWDDTYGDAALEEDGFLSRKVAKLGPSGQELHINPKAKKQEEIRKRQSALFSRAFQKGSHHLSIPKNGGKKKTKRKHRRRRRKSYKR